MSARAGRLLITGTLGLCVASYALLGFSAALPVVVETEPNDEPHQGAPFTAPALLSGAMPKPADQDAYRWRISDADAQKLWTLTLTGMPEALTGVSLIRVTADTTGTAVTKKETLQTFGIRDGSRPVTRRNLLLPPGEIIVGIFGAGQSGGGFRPPSVDTSRLAQAGASSEVADKAPLVPAYRLALEAGESMSVQSVKSHDSRETAIALRENTHFGEVSAGETWYRFKVAPAEALSRYSIEAGIELSRSLKATLTTEAGQELSTASSDTSGQVWLPNLALEAGTYYLKVVDTTDARGEGVPVLRRVRWRAVGAVADGEEREPNRYWKQANQFDITQPLQGRMDERGDGDYFRFQLGDDQAQTPWRLRLHSSELQKVQVCLLTNNGTNRQCRNGAPPVTLDGLILNAGVHGLLVERSSEPGAYSLQWQAIEALPRNSEQEPNDQPGDASLFGKRRIIKGTLNKQDTDQVLLLTTEEPQLWRLQAIGTGLGDLRYWPQHGEAGQSVRASTGSRRLRLDNLFLLPGQHRFSLSAREDTSYVLRALPLGPPSLFVEREPNNDRNTAHSLPLNQRAVGLLTEKTDRDYFRWYLAAAQPVRLSLRPASDAGYATTLYHDGGQLKQFNLTPGTALEETLWLDPGDYYLSVTSSPISEAEYEVQVDQLAQPAQISDTEPNDNVNTAADWPGNWHFQGRLNVARAGVDWYRMPTRQAPLTLTLPTLKGARMQFVDVNRKQIATAQTDAQGVSRITLPAAAESYLYLSGKGEYDFRIAPEGVDVGLEPAALPLVVEVAKPNTPIAAYSDWQQRLDVEVALRNSGTEALEVRLNAQTTDDRWQLSVPAGSIMVAAGAVETLSLPLHIAPDAWPDTPVALRIGARDERNRQIRTQLTLEAGREAVPVNATAPAPVPTGLQGHVNVAATALGAQWQSDPKKFDDLNDGQLALGWYFQSKRDGAAGPAVDVPVIDLAGDTALPVTGFALHPFGLQDGQPAQRNARDFEIDLSQDGVHFETVLKATLSGQTREQFYVLPESRPARFARLRLLSSKDAYNIALGEWKVLAEAASVAGADKRNLADPIHGGHVVWHAPSQPNYGYLEPMLKTGDSSVGSRMRAGADAAWVIGFHHNRAARVGGITWRNPDKGAFFKTAEVLVSRYSPEGPWHRLGTWVLDGNGEQAFDLPEPVWARFVKFDVADAAVGATMTLPDQIRITEAPDRHGSILGEWGYDSFRGPFERAHVTAPPRVKGAVPDHAQRSQARTLVPDAAQAGVVRLQHYDNWYRMQVPEGHNFLTLTLTGHPDLRAEAVLLDAGDEPVALEIAESLPDRLVLEARATPGDYLVKVSEPPRSVVFTWDTSGSTAAVRPIIRQAVLNYVQDVKPGLDEAQMLPFGGDFLSRQWLNQPYMLQSVLNDYNGAGNSSAAESALVKASLAMKDRRGQRIIVLITDAATTSDTQLWNALNKVRPRVIAMGVSSRGAFSSKPPRERDLMQDWAMVGDGYYEYVENAGAMERAFDRASSKIRQPAPYQIAMITRFEPDPEPGYLQVITAPPGTEPDVALPARTIEIVLDASGSMLQRLEGKRRYQIARETLTALVDEQLPGSVQFALRVFGHEEPGTCRTDLVMPPAKLDRAAVMRKLADIVPKNLAKTPIGASLKAAAQDLAKVEGEKVVLLITDGEETCEGDVEAAIETLAGAGVDAVVNIVGFAVENPELEATFERWAKAGGGSYQSSHEQRALLESTRSLTSPTFDVRTPDGELLVSGRVGDAAVVLPPGTYGVRVGKQAQVSVVVRSKTTSTLGVRP